MIGNKEEQGGPLMRYLALRGWCCIAINYRLSPKATFPDHIIDVKRAIAWVREHGAEHGADTDFILIFESADGLIRSLSSVPWDQLAVDEFWA